MSDRNLLFLVRGDGVSDPRIAIKLGIDLMQRGHTVFLTDGGDDIKDFGDVVDGYVEILPKDGVPAAVLYQMTPRRALQERAVLALPANDNDLSTFANHVRSAQ